MYIVLVPEALDPNENKLLLLQIFLPCPESPRKHWIECSIRKDTMLLWSRQKCLFPEIPWALFLSQGGRMQEERRLSCAWVGWCHLSPAQKRQKHTQQLCSSQRSRPGMTNTRKTRARRLWFAEPASSTYGPNSSPAPHLFKGCDRHKLKFMKVFWNCQSLYIPSINSLHK